MAIPLTARAPVEFTPPALTARNRIENAAITAANVKRREAGEAEEPLKDSIKIICRVPTPYERDAFAASMVRGGVVHYSRTQIRDLMLAGVQFLHPPEKFDVLRAELEELWAVGDAVQECEMKRMDRYVELMERQQMLPPEKQLTPEQMEADLAKIEPGMTMEDSRRVRITAMQQDITSRYEPLQKAFADLAEQDTRRMWLCIETYVTDWTGLEHRPEGNGRGGLTRHEASYLRAQIQGVAFEQVGEFIFAMHSIDGDEEKNLASLIESSSAAIGSTAPESMTQTETAPGPSTDEPSTSTPESASVKTTGSSSNSSKRSGTKKAKSEPTPTVAP